MVHSNLNLPHLKTSKMSSELKLELPIYYTIDYKTKPSKTFLCGINWFRNAYYHEQNKIKTHFEDLISDQVKSLPIKTLSQFTVEYTLYYKNSSCDPSNIIALIEKFVLDGLQKTNHLTQDSVKYHLGSSFTIGGQDKENPRVDITVKGIE